MRYEVRHNNQVWHVFDTLRYMAIAGYTLEHRAFDECTVLNAA